MPKYLGQEDFFHRPFEAFGNGIEPTEEHMSMVREFLLEKWRERAVENGIASDKLPTDLTDSCKFSALFGSVVFGGQISGHWGHVFNLVDGEVIDINAEASDVKGRARIHRHDSEFISSYDFYQSMKTCRERVSGWLREFSDIYTEKMSVSVTPGL